MITLLVILTVAGAAAAIYGVVDTYTGGLHQDPKPGKDGMIVFSTRSKRGAVIGVAGALVGLASGLLGIFLT